MKAFAKNNKTLLSTVFLAIVLALIIVLTNAPFAQSMTGKNNGQASVTGAIHGNRLNVTIEAGKKDEWPANVGIQVWIADLAKTPIALAEEVSYDPKKRIIEATLPVKGWDKADRSLYSIWYRVASEDMDVKGATSLRAVLGSMRLQILSPSVFQVGSNGSFRLVVEDYYSRKPLQGVMVSAVLEKDDKIRKVFDGRTSLEGTVENQFPIPDDLGDSAKLKVMAQYKGEVIKQELNLSFQRAEKILITSDKPLYQPGQVIHIRSLSLSKATRKPIGDAKAVIEVEDAKGNKVFKKVGKTDKYGIMAADFQLAREVNMGNYRLRVIVDDQIEEKTVEVKKYVLPKFKVKIDIDKEFGAPGQTVTGTIDAQYIFGKPVAGGSVKLTGYASIVGADAFATLKGKLNAQGKYAFEMKLPDYFVGQDVDSGLARCQFHAEVVDKADHKQEALKSIPVSSQTLNAILVPESGTLVQGVSNRLYVLVSSPDGKPVKAIVEDPWKQGKAHVTDGLGLVTLDTPKVGNALKFELRIGDNSGNKFTKTYNMRPGHLSQVLLRPDRPVYKVGETAHLQILSSDLATKTVYLDAIRNGQTVLTRSETLDKSQGKIKLPITDDMTGTLLLHAYVIAPSGNLIRDTRVVYVNPASDLKIGIRPAKDLYKPGEEGRIDFKVTDSKGHPIAAALGVTIVDEAVFAMQDMQPGLEKVFFTLEKELMKPRFEFHSFKPDQMVLDSKIEKERARGYEVMLASVEPVFNYGYNVNALVPIDAKMKAKMQQQALKDLKAINEYLIAIKKQGKQLPNNLNAVDSDLVQDPWGNKYQGTYKFEGQYVGIKSAGPDKNFGTPDDILANDPKLKKERDRKYNIRFKSGRRAGGGFLGGAARLEQEKMVMDGVFMEEAMDEDAGLMPMAANVKTASTGKKEGGTSEIRVRKYFPETLYVNPALITDRFGKASISLPMADSITTWRIAAMANDLTGMLGSASAQIRVFQDFFVDIDFPVALTQNDEVTVPIALYNYLKKPQTITLTIEKAGWFKLLEGNFVRKIRMSPGEVKAVSLKLKAKDVGRHTLTVYAKGTKLSDAVRRPVEVLPDGKKFEVAFSNQLDGTETQTFNLPKEAIKGGNGLFVKIFPGLMSQVIDGLDSILRMPNGCFEQTSSATYPNIMVLDYMKSVGTITPEIQMKAEGYINQGYQRLLTFEVPGGGFEWFGNDPAHIILTAYGLMEFYDMSKVYNVDPDVISRTQRWLASKQESNGSWKPTKRYLDTVASKFTKDVTRNTAYVAWALGKTEYKGGALAKALAYLEKDIDAKKDAYTLALMLNAFASSKGYDAAYQKVLDLLMEKKKVDGQAIYWETEGATSVRSRGTGADIETTALIGQALIIKKRSPQTVNGIITYLAKNKDTFGNWYSTQATVFALKTLTMSAQQSSQDVNGEVMIKVNGKKAGAVAVTPDNADVVKMIDATELIQTGQNKVEVTFSGKGRTMYQIVGRYYIPWTKFQKESAPINIDVKYDKTSLKKDDTVTCNVKIQNNRKGDFGMVVIDLGVPPGFDIMTGDLAELVGSKVIQKFEITARQVIVYLDEVKMGKPIGFKYRLKAKFPVKAQTPVSRAYEYYNPDVETFAKPVEMVVAN